MKVKATKRKKTARPVPVKPKVSKPKGKAAPYVWTPRDGITQSIMAKFLRCPAETFLSVGEGWTSARPPAALVLGTLWHELMEWIYKKPKPPTTKQIPKLLSQLTKFWRKEYPRSGADEVATHQEHLAVIGALLPTYIRHWKRDWTHVEWVELEGEFCYDFDLGEKWGVVKLRGKRDGVRRMKSGSKRALWLFETKTASRPDENSLVESLPLDLQLGLYLWVLWKETGALPKGAVYNIVRKPALRLGASETFKSFAERMTADIAKRPEFYFIRMEVPFLKTELERVEEWLRMWCINVMQWWNAFGQHANPAGAKTVKDSRPREAALHVMSNPTQCRRYGGSCGFLSVCARQDYGRLITKAKPFSELSV